MIELLIITKWKNNNYDFILVIISQIIKIVYNKSRKFTIYALGLVQVILSMIM